MKDVMKPTVTHYPSIKTDQKYFNDFGIRQLSNLNNLYLNRKTLLLTP